MADDRNHPGRGAGTHRRPRYLAGHRRHAEAAGTPEAAGTSEALAPAVELPQVDTPEPALVADESDTHVDEPAELRGLSSPPLNQEPWAGLPDDTEPAAASPEPTPDAASTGRWARVLPVGLLVASIAVVALLGSAVGLRLVDRQAPSAHEKQAQAAVAAARSAATALLAYDYRTIGTLVAKNKPLLTTQCATQYSTAITKNLAPQIVSLKAAITAKVQAAGVRDVTANRASVLVFADLTSTNSSRSSARLDQVPATFEMVRQGKKWLVDSVTTTANTAASCGLS